MIAVAVQKVPFRMTKAYLLARKSIAFETQNDTSGERDWKSFTVIPKGWRENEENEGNDGTRIDSQTALKISQMRKTNLAPHASTLPRSLKKLMFNY